MLRHEVIPESMDKILADLRKDPKYFDKLTTLLLTEDPVGLTLVRSLAQNAKRRAQKKQLTPDEIKQIIEEAGLFILQAVELSTKAGPSIKVGKILMGDPSLDPTQGSHQDMFDKIDATHKLIDSYRLPKKK